MKQIKKILCHIAIVCLLIVSMPVGILAINNEDATAHEHTEECYSDENELICETTDTDVVIEDDEIIVEDDAVEDIPEESTIAKVSVNSWALLVNEIDNAREDGVLVEIKITSSLTAVDNVLSIRPGQNIKLVSSSSTARVLSRGSDFIYNLFNVEGKLTLENIIVDGGSKAGLFAAASLIICQDGSELNLKKGVVLRNNKLRITEAIDNSGSAIIADNSTINLSDNASITNNEIEVAITSNPGAGSILNAWGAGIATYNSKVTMTGTSSITNNKIVASYKSVNSGPYNTPVNYANYYGAGVYLQDSTLSLGKTAKIENNKIDAFNDVLNVSYYGNLITKAFGGGVYADNSELTILGLVSSNEITVDHYAINTTNPPFDYAGNSIISGSGGGVFAVNDSKVYLSGTVSLNKISADAQIAGEQYAPAYASGGGLTLQGSSGVITGNVKNNEVYASRTMASGGGILAVSQGQVIGYYNVLKQVSNLTISSPAVISGNIVKSDNSWALGGGVNVGGASAGASLDIPRGINTFNMNGGTISSNSVISKNEGGSYGAGMYLESLESNIKNAKITSNKAIYNGTPTPDPNQYIDVTAGGGILIIPIASKVVIDGNTVISKNSAMSGGGVAITGLGEYGLGRPDNYDPPEYNFEMKGNSLIHSNSASDTGDDVYYNYGNVNLKTEEIVGSTKHYLYKDKAYAFTKYNYILEKSPWSSYYNLREVADLSEINYRNRYSDSSVQVRADELLIDSGIIMADMYPEIDVEFADTLQYWDVSWENNIPPFNTLRDIDEETGQSIGEAYIGESYGSFYAMSRIDVDPDTNEITYAQVEGRMGFTYQPINNPIPNTGDTNNILMLMILIMFAGASLAYIKKDWNKS